MKFNFDNQSKVVELRQTIVLIFNEYLRIRDELLRDFPEISLSLDFHIPDMQYGTITSNDLSQVNALSASDKEILDKYFEKKRLLDGIKMQDNRNELALPTPSAFDIVLHNLNESNSKLRKLFDELNNEWQMMRAEETMLNKLVDTKKHFKDIYIWLQQLFDTGSHVHIKLLIDYWYGNISLEEVHRRVGTKDEYGVLKIINEVLVSERLTYQHYSEAWINYYANTNSQE